MKTPSLFAIVSAVALGIAFVLNFEAGVTLFVIMGVAAIAVADYSRTYRPLTIADDDRSRPAVAPQPHDLRLAA